MTCFKQIIVYKHQKYITIEQKSTYLPYLNKNGSSKTEAKTNTCANTLNNDAKKVRILLKKSKCSSQLFKIQNNVLSAVVILNSENM